MSKIRVVQKKIAPGSSPYNDWVEENGVEPELEAARLTEAQNDLLTDVLEALNAGAERKLSNQERRAFQLIVREGMSYTRAASIMAEDTGRSVSKAAVQMYVKRAAKKIRAFVIRNRDNGV